MDLLLTGAGGSAASNFLDALLLDLPELQVVGVDTRDQFLALSRARRTAVIVPASHPNYIAELLKVIDLWKPPVLWAQPDAEVLRISAQRSELPLDCFLPEHDQLELASDKSRLNTHLASAGVPVPESRGAESRDSIADSAGSLLGDHRRIWVRARQGAGSRASLPVSSTDQALSWCSWWVDERGLTWSDFMVSEFLPGREFAVQGIWQHGRLISLEARERVEYLYGFLSPSGQSSTPSVARTTVRKDVLDLGCRAVQALGAVPHGVYGVDIKEDELGRPKVTEINAGRFYTTSNFFAHAGVNMPLLAYRASLGQRLEPVGVGTLEPDLYWVRMVDMGFRLVSPNDA